MLNTALDISAGTGMDLAGATKILSQAYVGNLKGLKQLNLGLTNAELATKSYLEIEKLIAAQYAGQSKNAADSYQGSLNRLKIAAEEASEQIGQSLVASLSTSSGGMDKLIDKVDGAADSISGLITNIAVLAKDLGNLFSGLPGAGVLDNISRAVQNRLGKLSIGNLRTQVDKLLGRQGGFPQGVPRDLQNLQANAEKAKADKAAAQRQKELIALQKKAQLAEKNKLSLSKAAAVFDTTRISIAAALQATYDKETRLRLEALMAIEEENGELAIEKINQIAAFQRKADFDRLSGLKGITDTNLAGLNAVLMAELSKIETAKLAQLKAIDATGADQASKDAAKLAAIGAAEAANAGAFAKYNDALAKQGGLNDLDFYTKKTQISTLEVLRLASIHNTQSAQVVADQITLAAGLKTVEEIALKRKQAQAAEDKALAEAEAAKKAAALTDITTISAAETAANALSINGIAGLAAATTLAYNARLQQEQYLTTVRLAGIKSVQDAENDSLSAKLRGFSTTALGLANLANAERQIAISRLASDIGTASMIQGIQAGLNPAQAAVGARYAAQSAYNYYIQITAGIGDPEAIAREIEAILNQSGYRGTSTNRNTGLYIE
jgi:hypothetical protein